mgnify:CR=1 FL=1
MKNLKLLVLLIGLLTVQNVNGQLTPKEKGLQVITKEAIQAQLEFLASDWTEGRATGERGIYLAGDYIASMFKYSGIQPAGDVYERRSRGGGGEASAPSERSYFQNFTLLESVPDGGSVISVKKGNHEVVFQEDVDFRIDRAGLSMKLTAPVVFIGYGIKSEEFGLDDFSGVDLEGKIALRLSGFPGMNNEESPLYKKIMEDRRAAYQMNRNKNEILAEKGALAVIEVDLNRDVTRYWAPVNEALQMAPNESSWRSDWTRMRLDDLQVSNDPVVLSVSHKVANIILEGTGLELEKYETDAGQGKHYKPIEIRNVEFGMDVRVTNKRVRVRNVMGMIEGKNKDEFVVVGAHMDHMGMSGGRIWNGADDNGSGTVGMMTIARAFAATGVQPEKTILFCGWTGEEKGLLGSRYFTMHPTLGEIDQYRLYLNYDMISRDSPNDEEKKNCSVSYTEAYPYIEEITNNNAETFGISLNLSFRPSETPRGGSDYSSFSSQEVPIMAMMAGFPREYHTAADEVDLINWDKMLEIIKLGFLNMWDAANNDY